ncbi:MAG: hypothetical protein ABI557_08280 [Aureliella sp.]
MRRQIQEGLNLQGDDNALCGRTQGSHFIFEMAATEKMDHLPHCGFMLWQAEVGGVHSTVIALIGELSVCYWHNEILPSGNYADFYVSS